MRLLLVEDYAPLRETLANGLRSQGYAVDATGDGQEGLWFATGNRYDAIILDLMLPQLGGLEILKRLRDAGHTDPVLLLTARDTVEDRVLGLDHGADDYLTKPFAVAELLARVRALVRRGHGQKNPLLTVADLVLDTTRRSVRRGAVEIPLTPREFALLRFLVVHADTVVTRTQIWEHLYDFAAEAASNVVDVQVARLRRKLDASGLPSLIHTRRGHGYLLSATAPSEPP